MGENQYWFTNSEALTLYTFLLEISASLLVSALKTFNNVFIICDGAVSAMSIAFESADTRRLLDTLMLLSSRVPARGANSACLTHGCDLSVSTTVFATEGSDLMMS